MANKHSAKSIEDDIIHLRGQVAEMAGLAEVAIGEAIEALVKGLDSVAKGVVSRDKQIDALELEIEKFAVRVIATRAPMADDLREAVAAIRIAVDLERIGDHAKNIAKRSTRIEGRSHFEPLTLIPAMGELAIQMVHDVATAYAARDASQALDLIRRDAKLDAFHNSIFRNLITFMFEKPSTITSATELFAVSRNLKRIGDHVTNIAEMIYFISTGSYLADSDNGLNIRN
ncbi:MAG: phosphate signaling complex protein PhoU [Novosphingobium sp.]